MRTFTRVVLFFLLGCCVIAPGAAPASGAPLPPAMAEGTGTTVTVAGGPYPGLTLECAEPATLVLNSATEIITAIVQPAVPSAAMVAVAVSGLPAGSTWYLYSGELADPLVLTADAAGAVAFQLDFSDERYLSLQSRKSTYTLRYNATGGDCTMIGTWDPVARTCTLDRDVDQTIQFGTYGLTLDGAGHALVGPGGYGVYAFEKPNVHVRNLAIDGASYGIGFIRSNGSSVSNCDISNVRVGFYGVSESGVTVSDTRISDFGTGVDLRLSASHYLTGLDIGPGATGMYTWINNGTITNSVFHDLDVGFNCANNGFEAYNNVFRDCAQEIAGTAWLTLSRDPSPGPNIVGGPYIGGNFYTRSGGTGFSDLALDVAPNDGFADQPFVYDPGSGYLKRDDHPLVVYQPYVNLPPVLDPVGDRAVSEGETLSFTLSATDLNPQDTLTFSAANLPPGAFFDPLSATFTWTPGYDQAGFYPGVEFTVTDDGVPMALDVEIVAITVGDTNRPPVFNPVGPQSVLEYDTLVFSVTTTDPDGDAVAVQAGALPPGASFDPGTGVFAWRPDGTQVGVHTVLFSAADDGAPPLVAELGVVVTVGNVTSPVDLVRLLIAEILARDLPQPVVNSYLANLKKVEIFIFDGRLGPAVNQVEAFILKCEGDVEHGFIAPGDGEYLLLIANDLLALLQG